MISVADELRVNVDQALENAQILYYEAVEARDRKSMTNLATIIDFLGSVKDNVACIDIRRQYE